MVRHARAAPRGAPIVVGVGEQDGPVALTWAIAVARILDASRAGRHKPLDPLQLTR
jgi:hypothetical protein